MPSQRLKINLCGCGCGELVSGTFKRGHHMLVKELAIKHGLVLKLQNRKGEKHHSWRGGSIVHEGRVLLRVADGYILRSRLAMEKHLGRKLLENEIVHHVDEDITNDDISNLELKTRSTHNTHHRKGKRHTNDSRLKISENRIGKGVGERNCMYGKHHTPETISKISSARRLGVINRYFQKINIRLIGGLIYEN